MSKHKFATPETIGVIGGFCTIKSIEFFRSRHVRPLPPRGRELVEGSGLISVFVPFKQRFAHSHIKKL